MAFPVRLVCLSILFLLPSISDAEEPPPEILKEHLTVHATRLPDEEEPVEAVPAHVTVLTREDLERSGARTLQDALALQAGVILYDQVGNDVEKTLDLRGFSEGTGTAVFLDGVRLNDPRNNATALESIPLEAVERIEITRGSAAGLIGGGAEAGVIRVLTRTNAEPGGSVSAAGGSDGALRASGHLQGKLGEVELFASAAHDESDGFRTVNGQSDLDRYAFRAGLPMTADHHLAFTAVGSHLDAGAPGALRQDEADADFWQNQFNVVDGNDTRTKQAALSYQGRVTTAWSVAADLSVRDLEAEILTTGRSAAQIGGFFLEEETRTYGSTVEASQHAGRSTFTMGLEWWDGLVDARGFGTDQAGTVDTSFALADNRSTRRTGAAFVRESFALDPHWTLQAGLRADRDRFEYEDHTGFGPAHAAHTFSDVTGRAGVTWNPSPAFGAFGSFSQSFLPPTPEQLFAFPGFGSNENLEPERAQAWELGVRARGAASMELTAALFLIDTEDEIVFDATVLPFGQSVNAGETRRKGFEIAARGQGGPRVSWFGQLTWTDAAFRGGEDAGKNVPLVPDLRLAAGADVQLWKALRLHAEALHVGEQVLDNDQANEASELPAYTIASARLSWQAHRNVVLFAEGRNLFDERYATRGIYAFGDVFITPAPGRRWFGGATLTF